jgi:hypothetical protein
MDILLGMGIAFSMIFLGTLGSIANAIKAVAKGIDKRNEIERKKMELEGLALKQKGVFSGDVDKIVDRSY